MRLAYLRSQYPTVTHTFLLREIRALRDSGLDIQVISIRGSDRSDHQLSSEEREERDKPGPGWNPRESARACWRVYPLAFW
jgi:hypothetical protein